MKKIGFVTIFLFLIIGISLIALVSWWKTNTSALSADKSTQRIVIPKGESAEEIGNILFEKNIIRNPLAFKLYVQFFGKQTSINAGEFKLSPSMSLDEILETLGKGPEELWVTIP